ncbi:MAG: DNA polymerase I [Deltaproteobacteria bacterium]|nr:MAG: DNA polymerase I [Deltaproteobacteria bacterium]
MSHKRLYLVDASGYIFRAYYAIRPLSNSKGLPTNALFGFTNMMVKLLKEHKPDLIGVVFDVARKTFRNEKYPEYKANRSEPPPDLVPQFPYFRKIIQALNLPVLELPNYEADDVIGTIASQFEKKDWETVIVTGDKDMMQLVDDHILIFDSMKEKWIREPEVKEKFGVGPKQVTDILALAGDSSDNIPGVPGIGDKTATKLIQEYGSLENLLVHAGEVKGKMGEQLVAHADQARLCKELATIVTNAPLSYDLKDFEINPPDPEKMRELFEELEFKKFLLEWVPSTDATPTPTQSTVELTEDVKLGLYLLDPDGFRNVELVRDHYLSNATLEEQLKKENLWDLYQDLELPLATVLRRVENNGVLIDSERLTQTSALYEKKMAEMESRVFQLAGQEFNLNSPKQLSEILFEKLKLPVMRKTKTGYSTDVDVLTELSKKHDLPKIILEYRSLAKLKSTYLDALPKLVDSEGRIHTSFNQTVAATGRLSSTDPNLQNIPIRTEEGRKIREAFIAAPGCVLLSADYSQIELRILAHLSDEPVLIQAFAEDRDIHRATAAQIFEVMEPLVTSEMRAVGKTVNFAVLYGQGAFSLSQELGISNAEANKYIKNYFAQYPKVTALRDQILKQVREEKIVHTLFGRLRRFPDILNPNATVRAMVERTAFNTVFQGTAADLIKKAMLTIDARLKDFPETKMLIQVHDELVFEVPEALIEPVSKMVCHEMSSVASLKVPLKVEVGHGKNWNEAH